MKKVLTLALIANDKEILLGMKKRGVGVGWWNGFGGKVEPGESISDAAKREVREEVGLEVINMEEVGLVDFHFVDNPIPWEVHIFKVSEYSGEPIESEEMKPQWFPLNAPPFEQMWKDDPIWYPYFLRGENFQAEFWMGKDYNITDHNIKKV